jgi:preprotein translocase subunit YajC
MAGEKKVSMWWLILASISGLLLVLWFIGVIYFVGRKYKEQQNKQSRREMYVVLEKGIEPEGPSGYYTLTMKVMNIRTDRIFTIVPGSQDYDRYGVGDTIIRNNKYPYELYK